MMRAAQACLCRPLFVWIYGNALEAAPSINVEVPLM